MQKCLVIDWLSLHVSMPMQAYENWKCRLTITKQGRQETPIFKQIHYIYAPDGDEIGYVCSDPRSEILSPDFGLLKINNKYLYQAGLKGFVTGLLKELGMVFVGVSRIDYALDFQRFNNNLRPEKFIQDFHNKKYAKTGRTKFATYGECGGTKGVRYETLRFGSGKSNVVYKLYNKTKEMSDQKHKQWIEDNWIDNGYEEGSGDVWRLEFSLKKTTDAIGSVDAETGEFNAVLDMSTLDCLDNIEPIYKFFFTKYFSFVHNEKSKRLDRCKPLVLFGKELKSNMIRLNLSDKKESDRANRIMAKHLAKLQYEMQGLDFGLAQFSNELTGYFIQSRGLRSWAEKKLNYIVTERQQVLFYSRCISDMLPDASYQKIHSKVKKTHNIMQLIREQQTGIIQQKL